MQRAGWATIFAAGVFAATLMVGPKAFGATSPCATSTTAGTGSRTSCMFAVQVDRSTLRRVAGVVKRQASLLGERNPSDVKAVLTTLGAATQLMGAVINDEGAPIFFVQARGDFTCRLSCSGPGPAPRGRFLALGLDVDTLDVRSFSLRHAAVDLRGLGHVHRVAIG